LPEVFVDAWLGIDPPRKAIYNWLQYFSPESLQSEFEKAGFTRHELYGDVAGAPFVESASEFAIVGKLE
jgi:hypothetical protein